MGLQAKYIVNDIKESKEIPEESLIDCQIRDYLNAKTHLKSQETELCQSYYRL